MGKKYSHEFKQIIDFSYVYKEHPKEEFVGRDRILKKINEFIYKQSTEQNILIIQGESGVGKTCLSVAIDRKKYNNQSIIFFVDFNNNQTKRATSFLDHLYYSLVKIFNLEITENIDTDKIKELINIINFEMETINRQTLKVNQKQIIIIDALDEVAPNQDEIRFALLTEVLPSLRFPDKFKVIVTTSRTLPKSVFNKNTQTNTILLTGDESKTDVKLFVYNKLSYLSKNQLKEICEKCKGNFQYTIVFTKMAKKGEINLDSIPNGLYELYDRKMDIIKKSVGRIKFKILLEILRLIAILPQPLTVNIIFEIMDIDLFDKDEYIFPIELFLNGTSNKSKTRLFKFHHKSIHDYIKNDSHCSLKAIHKIKKKVINYYYKSINLYGLKNVSNYLFSIIPFCNDFDQIPQLRKEFIKFHRLIIKNQIDTENVCEILFKMHFIFICCVVYNYYYSESKDEFYCNNYIFFNLLLKSLKLHCYKQIIDNSLILRHLEKNSFTNENVILKKLNEFHEKFNIFIKSQSYKQLTELNEKTITNKIRDVVPQILRDSVSTNLDAYNLDPIFLKIIHKEINNPEKIYEICDYYANKWFPIEEITENSQPIEHSKRQSSNKQTNKDEKEKTNIFEIYDNFEPPEPLPIKNLREFVEKELKSNYDIIIVEPLSEYYTLGLKISDKNFQPRHRSLIKEILRNAHEDSIILKKLFNSLNPNEQLKHEIISTANKRKVEKAISNCNIMFNSCLEWKIFMDSPFPRLVLQKNFTYLFITPIEI